LLGVWGEKEEAVFKEEPVVFLHLALRHILLIQQLLINGDQRRGFLDLLVIYSFLTEMEKRKKEKETHE